MGGELRVGQPLQTRLVETWTTLRSFSNPERDGNNTEITCTNYTQTEARKPTHEGTRRRAHTHTQLGEHACTFKHTHTHIHAHVNAHSHTRTHECSLTPMHTPTHTHTHANTNAHSHIRTHERTLTHTFTRTHIHTHAHTNALTHTCLLYTSDAADES